MTIHFSCACYCFQLCMMFYFCNITKSEFQFWKEKRRILVVSMSAASNVTGIVTDTNAVARIAHQHGALAVFDYAAGGKN